MANPEHVEILKQGVEVWNRWRDENPGVEPDLRGADLREADLREAHLREANLREADLSGASLREADLIGAYLSKANLNVADLIGAYLSKANLYKANLNEASLSGASLRGAEIRGANLYKADLRGAELREADLTGADLHEANFRAADLTGADLREAHLRAADLRGARLRGTNLKNARCWQTTIANVDLSATKHLEAIRHAGPSTIGIDTLYESKGNIPEAFLRGCGVPDQMIEYARSLTANPIEYYSCFISYSHKDEVFAKRLHADLQTNNVRCWYAPHDMKIGDKIRSTIDESIRFHDKTLLILSEHSVQSDWVEHEVEHALDIEKVKKRNVLFPVRMDEAVMESKTGWAGNVRRQRHIGDFTRWKDHDAYSKAFERLLRDLKAG